jgi:hypothetical protein
LWEAGEKVKKLQDDIAELSGKLAVQDAADKVREFWERVVSWFQEKRGQAVTTDNEAETEPAK